MLTIRDVREPDIAAVREVLVATWHATYDAIYGPDKVAEVVASWHSLAGLSAQLGRPDTAFLLAERDGQVVATSYASLQSDGSVQLNRLYVLAAEQGRGIGRRLMDATLRRFPAVERVWLEVEPRNAQAVAFYERQGFRLEAPQTSCGGRADLASVIMTKRVSIREHLIRRVEDADAQDLFGLLSLCFAEYPGCFVDPHGDLPDLRRPASAIAQKGGAFLVVEDENGRVCACIAVDFPEQGSAELHRLYVRPDQRRRGLGEELVRRAESLSRERGATKIFFWSDTRFSDAHRLYTRLGYVGGQVTRDLGDISNSVEYRFDKRL